MCGDSIASLCNGDRDIIASKAIGEYGIQYPFAMNVSVIGYPNELYSTIFPTWVLSTNNGMWIMKEPIGNFCGFGGFSFLNKFLNQSIIVHGCIR